MLQHNFIRPIIAALLLIVFACGITPKKTLHDLVASHKDTVRTMDGSHGDQLSIAGLNCKCDNLVAESVFISAAAVSIKILLPVHVAACEQYGVFSPTSFHWFTELRGPPVIG